MRRLGKQLFVAIIVVFLSTVGVTIQANRAEAQVGIHIGVEVPVFPRLVVVPGYPVYYAPDVRGNYFFYDGFFWVFNVDDGFWYSSTWYNGPWVAVEPAFVPQPILVVPYRYYRVRPVYWGGWVYDRPPRWDVYWGADWVRRRPDWDHWDRSRRYTAAPLPLFERDYRGRYPAPAQQINIYREKYNYRPRDVVLREHETTIIDRQSRGGERASGRAEWLGLRNEERTQRQASIQQNRQTRENTREQDRAQRQSNVQQNRQQREAIQQQDRAQRQSNAQAERQRQENLRAQRESNVQQNRQQREAIQQQDRAQHQAEVQQNKQQRDNAREQEKAQRQSNAEQNRQQRQAVQQQDRAQRQASAQASRQQREANVQAERQRQENAREQRESNVQQNRQQREAVQQQDRAQRQAQVQQNRQPRENTREQANAQRENRARKGEPEKGQGESRG
jgi:hypothetical protein